MTGRPLARSTGVASYRRPSIKVSRYTSGLPKVVVLHDHAYIREVLKLVLDDRIEIVAETRSGRAAVALCELLVPDVVVAGEMLMDGVTDYYVPSILQTGARILLLSETEEASRLLKSVEMGITGIIDVDQSPSEMAAAVLLLAAGGAVFPPEIVSVIAADWRRAQRSASFTQGGELTNREREVLGAMSDGLSAKAVAHHLGIAIKTVENHKTRIFDKLGVRTQAQAVALVIGDQAGRSVLAPSDAGGAA
jgi:DNA-binding NarL/FixJ family response regulator